MHVELIGAAVPGLNRTAADRTWLFARAWLYQTIRMVNAS